MNHFTRRPIFRILPFFFVAWLMSCTVSAKPRPRPLELKPIVGYSWVNLTGFSQDKFVETVEALPPEELAALNEQSALEASRVPVQGNGPSVGAALDLRLWVFSVGAQYSYAHTPDFGLHTVGATAGMRLGGRVAYTTHALAGYAIQTGLPDGLSTRGFVVGAGNGFDFRLGKALSLGIGVDVDVLLLTRDGTLQGQAAVISGNVTQASVSKIDGSALGFQIRPELHLVWHI